MSQTAISLFLNGWLVIATILFTVILWWAYRRSARDQMDRNARIPFDVEGDGQ
ncbi:cbb3-type cytochrome c oxidase subunit 3 [Aminobacter sp. AP02]|uniref:cbb3-type cytochrome oxidase subunit 3 n=1 Tax=Aminobacter sp. AP02 TaxID=2135737 RepID=UPI000D6B1A3A|nr:cbb3-type cytochrome c oxidase subunit 3 [Aminobacter sp. AP02]PWK74052.1 cbb3-type cytochrome oxidase subunit 3 [Aminobacter sp. AP02]